MPRKRRFYSIHDNGDGTADVYLTPNGVPDRWIRVVRGVHLHDRLEKDIRLRYEDWCDSAETVAL